MAKHSLLQTVLTIDDLFSSAKPGDETFYFEDAAWLDSLGIRYTSRPSSIGWSRFQNNFYFANPKSKKAGERLIKHVKNPANDTARFALFSWADIKAKGEASSKFYVICRDSSEKDASNFRGTFCSDDVISFSWDKREQFSRALAA